MVGFEYFCSCRDRPCNIKRISISSTKNSGTVAFLRQPDNFAATNISLMNKNLYNHGHGWIILKVQIISIIHFAPPVVDRCTFFATKVLSAQDLWWHIK